MILEHFINTSFDFEHIKKVCKNFVVIHGDNDDKVPFSHAEELSKNLNCKLVSVPNGGHLGGSDGWRQLPQALEAINEMMK
jgi:predicted alpha/beta hydrolase family esterase